MKHNNGNDSAYVDSDSAIATATQLVGKPNPKAQIKSVTYNDFEPKLFKKMMKSPDKLHCIIWTFPNGQEHAFGHLECKLDTQEFEYGGKRYIIDRNKIQNRFGIMTYNTTVNDSTGGLSFIKKSDMQKEVDAKNYAEGVRRNWFTALWGTWKIPFLVMVIAMCVALALAFVAMYFATQWQSSGSKYAIDEACLNDLSNTCLEQHKQANIIKAQQIAEEEAKKALEAEKNKKK